MNGLRSVVRKRLRKAFDPLVRARVSELVAETRGLRGELSDAQLRVEELTALIERLDKHVGRVKS
jgi:hypothetical protein